MTLKYDLLALRARQGIILSFSALLVVITFNTVVLPSCQRQPNMVIWLLHVIPLLIFLPWILKQHVRAHAWLCFLLLFYFLLSVPVAFACASGMTVLEMVLVVVLFVAAMLYIRWRSRALSQK